MTKPNKRKSIPIFWQLYTSIIAALSLVALVLVAFVAYQDEKTSIDDFYLDVSILADKAHQLWQKDQLNPDNIMLLAELTAFEIIVVDQQEYTRQIAGWQFVEKIEGVEIYADPEKEIYLSVHPLSSASPAAMKRLILKDTLIEQAESELSTYQQRALEIELKEEEISKSILLYLILLILFLVGLTLLLLVHRLKKHVNELVETSEQWGKGLFQVKANEAAPHPLGELAAKLNLTATELARVIQEQKIMMHAMSHELRNPLNAFQLALEMLKRKHPSLTQEPLVMDLERYADELEHLTTDILQLARMSHEKESQQLEWLMLDQVLQQRIDYLSRGYPRIRLQADIQQQVGAKVYPLYMQLAIDNLLTNAGKYARQNVRVSLTKAEQTVRIAIEDDGPGIPEEKRQQVRLAFSRLDQSRNKQTGGFGLGLAIVQAAMEKHAFLQSALDLETSQLGGLKATITLHV